MTAFVLMLKCFLHFPHQYAEGLRLRDSFTRSLLSQRGHSTPSLPQREFSSQRSAATSSGNICNSSIRVIPVRHLRPGPLCLSKLYMILIKLLTVYTPIIVGLSITRKEELLRRDVFRNLHQDVQLDFWRSNLAASTANQSGIRVFGLEGR